MLQTILVAVVASTFKNFYHFLLQNPFFNHQILFLNDLSQNISRYNTNYSRNFIKNTNTIKFQMYFCFFKYVSLLTLKIYSAFFGPVFYTIYENALVLFVIYSSPSSNASNLNGISISNTLPASKTITLS